MSDPSTNLSASPAPALSPAVPSAGLWDSVDALHAWLDADRAVDGREGLLLRILKLSEEVGEVAEAVIGATGQNPRKGVTHGWDDVQAELCDVALTALVALRGLTPDAREVFTRHLDRLTRRSLGTPRQGPSEDRSRGGS
ncbi:MazG-like family protein [Streptomyces sp. NPDC127091]|uniref:MazG-like family protein n=1 Tax=Streptomyces cathayae TaxID=3031124 RepID=A0ABY8KA03_9ACTN|nr:MazG-like family protein [Streptomyces sp. HUAS 5]WGD43288.1 MazG-like family protein [Streptomyces sp. HUAS 5]